MSRDTLTNFILLRDLKFSEPYDLGGWGIGIDVKKASDHEVCPHCATPTSSIYGHRTIEVQDEPIRGKAAFL
jgi:transposase